MRQLSYLPTYCQETLRNFWWLSFFLLDIMKLNSIFTKSVLCRVLTVKEDCFLPRVTSLTMPSRNSWNFILLILEFTFPGPTYPTTKFFASWSIFQFSSGQQLGAAYSSNYLHSIRNGMQWKSIVGYYTEVSTMFSEHLFSSWFLPINQHWMIFCQQLFHMHYRGTLWMTTLSF